VPLYIGAWAVYMCDAMHLCISTGELRR